jgi:hypothetical protein
MVILISIQTSIRALYRIAHTFIRLSFAVHRSYMQTTSTSISQLEFEDFELSMVAVGVSTSYRELESSSPCTDATRPPYLFPISPRFREVFRGQRGDLATDPSLQNCHQFYIRLLTVRLRGSDARTARWERRERTAKKKARGRNDRRYYGSPFPCIGITPVPVY